MTPLIYAFYFGDKGVITSLLKNGADPNLRITTPDASPGVRGQSAVTMVAGAPDNDYIRILLDHGGDPNAKNSDGDPILITMELMSPRNYGGIDLLLERGAEIDATDSSGATVTKIMALLGDFEHVYYMLQRGADYTKKTSYGSDVAADVFGYKIDRSKHPEAYEWQRKCKEFLLAHGVTDPGPVKPKKLTPEEQAEWQRTYQKALEEDMELRAK